MALSPHGDDVRPPSRALPTPRPRPYQPEAMGRPHRLDFEARVAQPPRGGQQNEPARWLDAYYGELEDTSNSRSVELGVGGAPSSSSRGRSI